MAPRNVFQDQKKVILGSKGHTWTGTIEILTKNCQVWSHEGSTFFSSKMDHSLAKNPFLGDLAHMSKAFKVIPIYY